MSLNDGSTADDEGMLWRHAGEQYNFNICRVALHHRNGRFDRQCHLENVRYQDCKLGIPPNRPDLMILYLTYCNVVVPSPSGEVYAAGRATD